MRRDDTPDEISAVSTLTGVFLDTTLRKACPFPTAMADRWCMSLGGPAALSPWPIQSWSFQQRQDPDQQRPVEVGAYRLSRAVHCQLLRS